jgi:GNAT superfamily N-acetyltransferase
MHFRPALPADAENISALIMSFQPQLTIEPDGRGAEQFFAAVHPDAERGYIESEKYQYLVAEVGNALAGVIAIFNKTHLFRLFVARTHQRQGLARELWNRLHQPEIRYTVNASLAAVPTYERLGFVATSEPQRNHGIAFLPMRWEAEHVDTPPQS